MLAVTATEYSTSFLFLALESGQTRAIVLELANLATSEALEQSYLGWQLTGSGWRPILNLEAREDPLREPWRLFPSDSLRLTVTADGDADALIIRSGQPTTLSSSATTSTAGRTGPEPGTTFARRCGSPGTANQRHRR